MQEEMQHTMALAVTAAEMTINILAVALKIYLNRDTHKTQKSKQPKVYKGKQSLKKLVQQDAQLSNITISKDNIGEFTPIAKKYGIDFALKSDKSTDKPTFYVFFKGKDAEIMNLAFKEFTAKKLKREGQEEAMDEKPSITNTLAQEAKKAQQEQKEKPPLEKIKTKDKNIEL